MKKTLTLAAIAALCATMVTAEYPATLVSATQFSKKNNEPTNEKPVLMIGDSMMRILGREFEKRLKKSKIEEATSFSSLGSGLARLDAFDWYTKIDQLLAEVKPKVVVISLATNDRQVIRDDAGNAYEYGTDAWFTEYGSRLDHVLDTLLAEESPVEKIIWLLLPDMKEPAQQDYSLRINHLIVEKATATDNRKENVRLFDSKQVLSRKPGTYSQMIMSKTAEALSVRDIDGIHLTAVGAKLLADSVVTKYWDADKKKK